MTEPYPRHRVSDQTNILAGSTTLYSGPGCTSTTSVLTGGRVGVYRMMNDIVTPDFKAQSARGGIVNTSMSSERKTFTCTPTSSVHSKIGHDCSVSAGSWKQYYSNLFNVVLGPLPLTCGYPTTLDVDSLMKEASTMALSYVKNPSVQGLAFIGEIQQTINLLRNPISAATSFLQNYGANQTRIAGYSKYSAANRSANNRRQGKAALNAASSQTLAVNFGLKPLMMDIEGLIEALLQRVTLRDTARGKASDEGYTLTTGIQWLNGSALADGRYSLYVKHECVVRAGALYAFDGASLAGRLGLSLKDIPSAAWELLPWSFFIDWFSNIGKLIDAVTASCTNDFLAEWITVRQKTTVIRTSTSVSPGTGWQIDSICRDQDSCVYETFTRYPSPLSQSMGLVLNANFNRVPTLTALSLLMQQLTKRK